MVIDGLQRLTTLTLVYLARYGLAIEIPNFGGRLFNSAELFSMKGKIVIRIL